MSRKGQKLIQFSDKMLAELEEIAKAEGRNFTDLIRECARNYIKKYRNEKREELEKVS